MTKKNKKGKYQIPELMQEVSKTGDVKTNDFDLVSDKKPALSTIRAQIKNAIKLKEFADTVPVRTEFDRLKIAINLLKYGEIIGFEDLRMEDVENPKEPPSYIKEQQLKWDLVENTLKEFDDKSKTYQDDLSDDFLEIFVPNKFEEYFPQEQKIEFVQNEAQINNDTIIDTFVDVFKDKMAKKRIRYDDYKNAIGLLNLFICGGYFVIDISGKWMYGPGILGSLHKDNIREALQKILDLHVVSFDIEKFIKYAQVFVCDVCVDIALASIQQVERYIDGLSSFFPISTNRFNSAKYKRHGLMLKPKSKSRGFSLIVYSKGYELDCSIKRSSKATKYTMGIGVDGEELAKRTIRFESKFYKLDEVRNYLKIPKNERGLLPLEEVLNSKAPVMLSMLELFSGNANVLLERLEWLYDLETKPDGLTLSEIFIAERFVEILKDNCFDIEIARSHIRTEYINASDRELEHFNQLANLRRHLLNFLVYRKPKSITIMLAVLSLLQEYYSTGMENNHA